MIVENISKGEIMESLSVLQNYISSLMATFSGCAYSIEVYEDELYGRVARITVNLPAKEALELWLKLIDYFPYEKYKIVLSVKWLGENNVSESELIDYLVKIMIKSKVGPKALPGFDSIHTVQSLRE